jgi:membrane protein involved in D-alanine export
LTPYAEFLYFLFLLFPLGLLVLLGLLGWLRAPVVLAISVVSLVFQYANPLGKPDETAAGLRQLAFFGGYLVASTVVVLAFGFARRRGKSRIAFYAALALALLPLIILKVLPLLSGLSGAPAVGAPGAGAPTTLVSLDVFGFLGLSYITFRVIDTIILLEDGVVKVVDPFDFVSYVAFWPTISAGPIDRYRRFRDDLKRLPRDRWAYLADVESGINRIAQGFLYKFILAVLVFRYALDPASKSPGLLGMVEYTYAYSFYLFFDFAGYSAFAIGVGRFCGIHVPENFNRPWLSRDFKDMWNRWHISLSWWLRDHVYMRFLLKAGKSKWFGGDRYAASYFGQLLTMSLMGAWHGLTPHYLVYGIYQAAMLVLSDLIGRWNHGGRVIPDTWLSRTASVFVTLNLFCFGLLIFSGHLFW